MDERDAWGSAAAYSEATAEAEARLRAAGEFSDTVALADLERYLSLTIEAALSSPSPLIRAVAMLDSRLGTRRLRSMQMATTEHAFVRAMYALRCEAEQVQLPEAAV